MEALFVIAVTFGLMWALVLRPRQRQVREHQKLVASLEAGDDVVLTAGIYGRLVHVEADEVSVEVAPDVVLRVARQAVLRRVEPPVDLAGTPATQRALARLERGDIDAAGDLADDPADDVANQPPDPDTDPPSASEPR